MQPSPDDDRRRMLVREQRRSDVSRGESLADRQAEAVISGQDGDALVARPAEVPGRPVRVRERVDLFPLVPPDVADPDVVGPGLDREAVRVAKAVGDDPARVRVAAAGVGVLGPGGPAVGVDADDGPAESRRIAARTQVLRPEGAALGGRRRRVGAARVAARVDRCRRARQRAAQLTVVRGGAEARTLATRCVEGAFRTEHQGTDRVAWVLLAPVLDQDVLIAAHDAARGGQPGEATGDDAAVAGPGRRVRAAVVVRIARGRRPARRARHLAEDVVVRVHHVDVRTARREGRIDGQAHQAAIPVVVDVRVEIGEHRRGGVVDARVELDGPALLGDEDVPVRCERDRHRVVEPGEHHLVLERGGHAGAGLGKDGGSRERQDADEQREKAGGSQEPSCVMHVDAYPEETRVTFVPSTM